MLGKYMPCSTISPLLRRRYSSFAVRKRSISNGSWP